MARRIGLACVLTAATTAAGFGISGITLIEMMRNSGHCPGAGYGSQFSRNGSHRPYDLVRFGPTQFAPPRAKMVCARIVELFTAGGLRFPSGRDEV